MNEAFNLIKGGLTKDVLAAQGITAKDINNLYAERITPDTDLPPLMPLFCMNDVPCFYRGELVADCGKAKSGKTTFLSIIMACALKQELLSLKRLTDEPLKVLWLDTEQSQQSTQEIMKQRIMPLAEVDKLDHTLFYAFNFRGMGYDKRRKMVDTAIRSIKPDLVILDGVKDLMTDINDAVQATNIMEQLMGLAKEANCCIVCVLHQNKSDQDHNMRGSIGTELTNKAFEVFQCESHYDSDVFKVTHLFSRKQKMKRKFYYQINEQGLPAECNDFKEQPRDDHGRFMSEMTPEELRKLIIEAMEGRNQRPFVEVMAVVMKKKDIKDKNIFYRYMTIAENLGIVRKEVQAETGKSWLVLREGELPF